MRLARFLAIFALTVGAGALLCACEPPSTGALDIDARSANWQVYNGPIDGSHYSPLDQINRSNVDQLKVAWIYDFGEPGVRFESNPLIVGDTLYGFTPSLKIIALNAVTGELMWDFDSGVKGSGPARGLTYWTDGTNERLFVGIMNYLYALRLDDGRPVTSFGDNGRIDLRRGLRGDYRQHFVAMTSPGVVAGNNIVIGFRTVESALAPAGDIRAFDTTTGELVWQFHTIPRPEEFGHNTWPPGKWQNAGGANSWAGMVVDQATGIVFAPTGSAAPDFYGGDRHGDNLFANCLLALDASTGERIWHFQGVRHDIWDRDFPSPPVLVTVTRNGKAIDAIAQPSKQGYLFVLDRRTGEPLFPIEEVPYPNSDVPGEVAASTQPRPLLPMPFARQRLTAAMLTKRSAEAHQWAAEAFRTFRSDGQFVPFTVGQQTVVFPGFDGGAEWGGAAYDPESHVIYINSNDIAWTGALDRVARSSDPAEALYQDRCLSCHGPTRAGSPPTIPSLLAIDKRLSTSEIRDVVRQGKGQMPAFPDIEDELLESLIRFVSTGISNAAGIVASDAVNRRVSTADMPMPTSASLQDGVFEFTGYRKFLDPDGYPAIEPPWGTLNAIDLDTGQYLWKVPLGEYPELSAAGMPVTGTENYGGPILTAGGLLFIGATVFDSKLRAFDASTGDVLWEHEMPHAGTATPSTYMVDGKQFLVIATSNSRNPNAAQGSSYIAFSLPQD